VAERFRLVLVALPSAVPAAHRLRLLLKVALRRLGLRCEHVEELHAGLHTPASGASADDSQAEPPGGAAAGARGLP
jgi:hypothetical protein